MTTAPSYLAATTLAFAALLMTSSFPAAAQGIPGVEANKCLAGKNKCVSKKVAGLMKCRELCQRTPDKKCGPVQTECEQKVMDKFDGGALPAKGCFEKLEGKQNPSKPDSLCTTTDDTVAVEAQVDAAVANLMDALEGTPVALPATCPVACMDAIIQWATHDYVPHPSDSIQCVPSTVSVTTGLNGSPSLLAASTGTGRCQVAIELASQIDAFYTSAEIEACLPLAASAVVHVTGTPCAP